MDRTIETGDFVKVLIREDVQIYVIQDVKQESVCIALVTDVDQEKVLISTHEGWKISGLLEKHVIEFISKESLPQLFFTKVPGIDMNILNSLDDEKLSLVCQTDRYAKSLCDSQELWKRRLEKYHPFDYFLIQSTLDIRLPIYYRTEYERVVERRVHVLKRYDIDERRFPDKQGFYSSADKAHSALIDDFKHEGFIEKDEEGNMVIETSEGMMSYKQFLRYFFETAEIGVGDSLYEYTIYEWDKPLNEQDPY